MHGYHLVDVVALKGGLITVEIIGLFLIDCLYIPVKYLRMKNIVMVKKTYIFTFSQLKTVIGIS